MADAIDAALDAPAQPSDAYLAAISALLTAMATSSTINEREVDALLDAMPDVDLRDGLRVALSEHGLRAEDYRIWLR